MAYYGICEACHKPVTHTPSYPVIGWETKRSAGGANHIKNRIRIPGRVRHHTCIDQPKLNADQQKLPT